MSYLPILILMLATAILGGIVVVLSWLLGPKVKDSRKDTPFECGVPPVGNAKHRFSVRFYLVAILFLLFDVEVIFFFPWAVVFKEYLAVNSFILFEMAAFIAILLVGYLYVLRKGALEWE